MGENTHERMIFAKPVSHGNVRVVSAPQYTEDAPRATMDMPTTAPTVLCVVDTGKPSLVATRSHSPTASKTHIMPYISTSGSRSYAATSAMPLRMVSVTAPPNSTAPLNSHTAAMATASRSVSAPDPTDVANAFDTSFAPETREEEEERSA